MLSLTTPAALLLAAASFGLTAPSATPVVSACHQHVVGVSDPDPADCPFCGGNPAVHVKVLWQIQKELSQAYTARWL